jgi:rRNA processing protein Gar1
MREGAGTDALCKLAFYADRIVLLDIVSPRSQVIDQSREGIKSLQYVIGPVEDAEEIALKNRITSTSFASRLRG